MVAPVKENYAEKSCAVLEVESVLGESTITTAFASSPMKLLAPRSRGRSVWVYTSSFGGGFVAGDKTRLDLRLAPNTRCFLGTQASTKIYRNPGQRQCGHQTRAELGADALLVFAPDPVQAFADSCFTQRQEIHLAEGAGLAFVDWFTSGRAARGERWQFTRFQSRNDVFRAGKQIFLDSVSLSSAEGSLASPHRAGRFNCFAMLLFVGAPLQEFATRLLAEISSRAVERRAALVTSASPVADGALLRVAGENVEQVGRELHYHLQPLTALLGDDPWARKW